MRVVLSLHLILLVPGYVYAQSNPAELSISYATHVQLAYSGEVTSLYQGKYAKAKRQNIQLLSHFAPKGDGVLDYKDISRLKDNRPAFFKILEKVDSKGFNNDQYLEYTGCLNAMGIYYHAMGQLRFADVLFTKCLKLRGEKFGKTSSLYVASLHNLANLRKDQGRFEAAEDMFNYVLRYYLNLNGEFSREYIIALNNKAMLDASLGRTSQAMEQLDKAMAAGQQYKFPDESIDEVRILINRGLLESESGNILKASELLSNAQDELQKKKYEDHPDYNDLVVFLGSIYNSLDSATLFNPLVETAIQKAGDTYGKLHPFYANLLELQAENNLIAGKYSVAEEQWQTILTIRLGSLGDRHPQYLRALAKLAIAKAYTGKPQIALKYFQKTMDTYLYLADMFFKNMSEFEQARFWSTFRSNINLFYEFALKNPTMPGVSEAVLNLQLNTKGMLLNNSRKVKEEILSGSNAELKLKLEQWQLIHDELAGYYTLSKEDLASEEIDLVMLEEKSNELEKELVRESEIFASSLKATRKEWQIIGSELKLNEAAVDIIRFKGTYGETRNKAFYFAITVKNGTKPVFTLLKNGDDLEGKYYKFYKNAIWSKLSDPYSYKQFWEPLEQILKSTNRIYISPDGIYNNISILSLADANGRYILDEKEIVMVNSIGSLTRNELLSMGENGNGSVLLGNPLYEKSTNLSQLPGTELEVNEIGKILNDYHITSSTIVGAAATETALKKVADPQILHIATHGFFLADVQTNQMLGVQISNAKEHPLLRSGLVLAGSGLVSRDVGFDARDNGILTAFEAMNLKLRGTQLVVLSACETGLGEVVNGEGVYGLSRSFRIAGSKAVLISLWKVDDAATQLLMTKFYSEWAKRVDLSSSFIQAQKQIKEKFPDPYYWGAFVLYSN